MLEILYLIFRQSSPGDLVGCCPNGGNKKLKVNNTESDLLANLVEKETRQKKQAIRSLGTRHSRFGGTYEVNTLIKAFDTFRNFVITKAVKSGHLTT